MGTAARVLTATGTAMLLALGASMTAAQAPATGASTPDNPAAAVAAAAGHPAQRHLQLRRPREAGGLALVDVLDVEGSRRTRQTCQGALCAGTWFDGHHRYEFGINGRTYPAADPAGDALAATFAAIVSTAFAERTFTDGGGRVQRLAGDDERYAVRAPGGDTLIAVADPRDHRLTAVERADGTQLTALVANGTPPNRTYAADAYPDVTALATPLEAPRPPTLALTAPVTIPLHGGPLPLVSCHVGGRLATCLIDTGTSPSAMSQRFADASGAAPIGTMRVAVLGTLVSSPVVEAGPLEVGTARISGLRFAVVTPPPGVDFDVIVGSDALGGISVELDPLRNELRLQPSPLRPADATSLRFHDGMPYVDARLAGAQAPDALLLDTGDMAAVTVGAARLSAQPDLLTASRPSRAGGLGGIERQARDGTLTSFDVDGRTLRDIPAVSVLGQNVGHLGFGIAAHCGVLSFDLSAAWLRCGPRPAAPAG